MCYFTQNPDSLFQAMKSVSISLSFKTPTIFFSHGRREAAALLYTALSLAILSSGEREVVIGERVLDGEMRVASKGVCAVTPYSCR